MDDDKLIELVRNYPLLYSKLEKDYKNTAKKGIAWCEIADELGEVDSSMCFKRWNILRERYAAEMRKKRNETTDSSSSREWPYFAQLNSFLSEHYSPRPIYNFKLVEPVSPKMSPQSIPDIPFTSESPTAVNELHNMPSPSRPLSIFFDSPSSNSFLTEDVSGSTGSGVRKIAKKRKAEIENILNTNTSPIVTAIAAMSCTLKEKYLRAFYDKIVPIYAEYSRMSNLELPLEDYE